MSAGIIYPEYNGTIESVSSIKALLLGIRKGPWVILAGETDWIKLDKLGIVFKNTRLGTSLEGRRQGSPEDCDMELFRICRNGGCKFPSSNSRNSDCLCVVRRSGQLRM